MSLEASIAALTAQAGLLMDLPAQIAAAANGKLSELAQQFQARQASMYVIYYVDQGTGADTAAGTQSAPIRSIDEALRRTPAGGACVVRLLSDYVVSSDITIYNRFVRIEGDASSRKNIVFSRLLRDEQSVQKRSCVNIRLAHRAQICVLYVNLKLPSIGDWGGYANSAWNGVFCCWQPDAPLLAVSLYACGLNRPADCMSPMFVAGSPIALTVSACTETAEPMNGWWLSSYTNAAGTSVVNVSNVVTNLATI